MEYYFVYMTGLAGKDRGYWNAVNSAKLFSQLNPYFISVDSLTLFPDTELYRMEQEGKFTPAGEKERMEELQVFIKNLQIRTHLFANSSSNFYPVTAYLPKDRDFVVSELQHVCDTVSEDEIAAVPVSSCFHSFQCGVLQGGLEAVYFLFHAELFTTVFDRPFSLQIENIFMLRKEISHLILPVKKMVWLCLGFLLRRMWKGRNNYGTD